MGQHGFLRDTDCKLEKVGKNFVTYSLTANAETLKQYPFFFKFLITYTMGKNTLKIKAQVTHLATEKGEAKMPVVLAFHPYYAVKDPGKVQVTTSGHTYFDNLLPENKKSFVKTSSLAGSKDLVHVKDNVYQVQGNPDAHIVDHQQKFTVLKPGTEDYALKLSWDKFAYLTVWRAKPDAAYVCVEPATGLKNKMVEAVNQGKKDGVIYLAKGKTQEFNLQIAVC
jgi:galactose mutarotase-like enzyme